MKIYRISDQDLWQLLSKEIGDQEFIGCISWIQRMLGSFQFRVFSEKIPMACCILAPREY